MQLKSKKNSKIAIIKNLKQKTFLVSNQILKISFLNMNHSETNVLEDLFDQNIPEQFCIARSHVEIEGDKKKTLADSCNTKIKNAHHIKSPWGVQILLQ